MPTKKLYYKIGEACKRLDIQPYVLRYWETEFPVLSPNKSKSGQRVYSDGDLRVIARVKELLYEEGYTIAGAKKKLEAELDSGRELKAVASGTEATEPAATPAPKKKAKAAAKKAPPPAGEAPGVDSAADQTKMLRQGIRKALAEAQEIAALLKAPGS